MILTSRLGALALAASVAVTLGAAAPASAVDAAFTDAQQAALGPMIKDYLMRNPEVLRDVMAALDKKQKQEDEAHRLDVVDNRSSELFDSSFQATIGNPEGKITVVEFFDYNCGYCRKALGDIQALIKSDPKLRVVIKDFPVLGPESLEASQVAVAVRQQLKGDKLFEFHQKLLETKGRVNGARAIQVAKELGADAGRLQKDMASAEVKAALSENRGLGDRLGLSGTPAFVIGEEIIPGAVGVDPIRKTIADVRQCGHASC